MWLTVVTRYATPQLHHPYSYILQLQPTRRQMDELELKLWCCLEGGRNCFQVSILFSQTIHDLKGRIYLKAGNFFARARRNARDLTLTKVYYIMISTCKSIF